MRRASLFLGCVAILSSCGSATCSQDGGTAHDGGGTCDAKGRTCASAFGVFAIEATGESGCTGPGWPRSASIGLLDGGVGTIIWDGTYTNSLTRSDCQYLSRYLSTSSQPIEFTYDPACDVLTGRIQAFSSSCNRSVLFTIVGRKP